MANFKTILHSMKEIWSGYEKFMAGQWDDIIPPVFRRAYNTILEYRLFSYLFLTFSEDRKERSKNDHRLRASVVKFTVGLTLFCWF